MIEYFVGLGIIDFLNIRATDKPFEGKSTFHVEMEETLTIINDCTENSLCIFDELGNFIL